MDSQTSDPFESIDNNIINPSNEKDILEDMANSVFPDISDNAFKNAADDAFNTIAHTGDLDHSSDLDLDSDSDLESDSDLDQEIEDVYSQESEEYLDNELLQGENIFLIKNAQNVNMKMCEFFKF